MEIDIKMSARNVTLLVYNPPLDSSSVNSSHRRNLGKAANAGSGSRGVYPGQDDGDSSSVASAFGGDDDLDVSGRPEVKALSRQISGGSVNLGESGEMATEEATLLRERLELPALVASVVIDVRQRNSTARTK